MIPTSVVESVPQSNLELSGFIASLFSRHSYLKNIVFVFILYICTPHHTHTDTHTDTHTHARTHARTHAHTHTHTNKKANVHTRAYKQARANTRMHTARAPSSFPSHSPDKVQARKTATGRGGQVQERLQFSYLFHLGLQRMDKVVKVDQQQRPPEPHPLIMKP